MEKDCNTCKFELYNADEIPCKNCGMDDREYWLPKPQTNADRIRAMSDEELAKFIVGNAVGEEYQTYEYEFSIENVRYFKVDYEHQGETAEDSVLYWLKQPADMRGEEDG